jgi:6-phosphogluconolactonase
MDRNSDLAVVGTYGPADREGVHTVAIDTETGELDHCDGVVAGPDPTFIAVHPDGTHVFAAVRESEGRIKSFAVERDTGALTRVGDAPSGAVSPCRCSVETTGRYLLAAHYAGGAVSMLPLGADGEIGDPVAVVEHEGAGPNPDRQTAPHPHSITPGPENRFAYVPDLGTDEVVVYEMDLDGGRLDRRSSVAVTPGAGPRHLAFGPSGERVYLINELDSTVVAFESDDDG